MSDIITLNCLLLPRDTTLRSNLSEGSITTLKISTGETVDQLRIMIRERWPSLFEKVPPADFVLCKIDYKQIVLRKVKREKKWLHMS